MNKYLPDDIDLSSVDSAHWKAQDSTKNSILFFDVKDSNKVFLKSNINSFKFKFLILSKKVDFPLPSNVFVVEKFLDAQVEVCDRLYPIGENKSIIGVTGTNGKTTVTFLAQQIANQSGLKSFSLGSLGIYSFDKQLHDMDGMTTPPLIELRKLLHTYFKNHDFCFMEVSSHAVHQERIRGLKFKAGAWTNFSQDHLDYHGTMDEYFNCKLKFITDYLVSTAYVPCDNSELKDVLKKKGVKVYQKSVKSPNHPFFKISYNLSNFEVAYNLVAMQTSSEIIFDDSKFISPPGRLEFVVDKDKTAIVDYAHTPDAIENVLSEVKNSFPDKSLISVFGCGGDRDKSKRPEMGRAVSKFSNKTIVTSDNPRTENPQDIIDDIIPGIIGEAKVVIERREAIKLGKSLCDKNSLLIILGKGAESYQIIGLKKKSFDDRKVFKEV